MAEKIYGVAGMTCEHCVRAVSEGLGDVAGVERVSVELDTGRVTVWGEGFSDQQVAVAVSEAGYQLCS